MPRITRHAACRWLLVAVSWVIVGCATQRPESEPTLLSLVAFFDEENPQRVGFDKAHAALTRRALPLAQLESAGRRFPATAVYVCRELAPDDPWRCETDVAGYADDTIHTTESPSYAVLKLGAAPRLRLVGPSGEPAPGLIVAGVGDPVAMHAVGYRDVTRLVVSGAGELSGVEPAARERLLFALFRDEAGLVRKHIWVIQALP